jgi:hypothetical protein
MLRRGQPLIIGRLFRRSWVTVVSIVVLLTSACEERDRLTFPTPSDGVGPVTTIDQPNGSDTTVPDGPDVFVNGRTIDPDGVDTVYFLVTGGNQSFHPFRPDPPTDTVRFGLPITTFGHAGDTILVQVFGVDLEGNHGTTSSRRIAVE